MQIQLIRKFSRSPALAFIQVAHTCMDGASRSVVSGRSIKPSRGGAKIRGRSSPSSTKNGNGSFNRKIAGTPLFQSISDPEESNSDGDRAERPENSIKPGLTKLQDSATYGPDAEAARKSRFETHASANKYLEVTYARHNSYLYRSSDHRSASIAA